ncbi:iron-regulated protein [Phormidesmis priestleyi ULC007]|uniref:Iron-regulated protein n=2 Tax=Phormidesmis priestleyi TaxID=268141 RepID=A0A2T1DI17_9CYAN|nr:iron-regulated protein [Phormidesmis priestleyi ULC007]PZO49079.1 MAG: iron-regulated protein [Phormidesmis priestleyi]
MSKLYFVRVWVWSLSAILVCAFPVFAQTPESALGTPPKISVSSPQKQSYDPQNVLQQLAMADVVYLGETHDRADDHRAQFAIIQSLHRLNPNLAIAMEMFQRPYQSVLDRYLAGTITEAQLKELTEYETRWGFPWEYYAPILRFAKKNRLPVIALNTPTEITRKVSRSGLESLTLADRRFIPPLSEILAEPDAYRERMRLIYQEIHQGKGNSSQFDRFFLAQILWDETMADRVSQFLRTNPTTNVVVLAGQGHIVYGDGIPNRVARRMPRTQRGALLQSLILLNPPQEMTAKSDRPIADYFWNAQFSN